MPYSWSYAPTARATCKGKCKEKIEKGALRFATSYDQMTSYRCLNCVTDKQVENVVNELGGLDAVEGFNDLNNADRKRILALSKSVGKAKAKAKADAKADAKAKAKGKAKAEPSPEPKAKAKGKAKAKAAAKDEPETGSKRKAETTEESVRPEAKKARTENGAAKSTSSGNRVRPVDAAMPGREKYSVVDDWSILLNQTNVGANNNKYYKIQVVSENNKQFFCWTHWGRVGHGGQSKLEPCGTDVDRAIKEFKAKFKQKTSVDHAKLETHDWTPKVGKYTYVEVDEQEGAQGDDSSPLGKLSPQQIEKGQGVLEKISTALQKSKKDMSVLDGFSSQFYTLIPHDFGFKVPPSINSKDMLEKEEELLKFYLRMGFEEVDKGDDGLTPLSGVYEMDLPASLVAAAEKLCGKHDIQVSDEKGEAHAKKQSGNPSREMSAHLYSAIMLYTSNAIYKDLNAALRNEDRRKISKYFKYLRLLLEALRTLPQKNKTVWRGISVDLFDQYQVGSTITWWGVSSCTADINVAKQFMKGCGGKCTLLTVETSTAADISDITFFGNEKENLVAPGTQFKVISSERKGNVTEISMKEVGQALS